MALGFKLSSLCRKRYKTNPNEFVCNLPAKRMKSKRKKQLRKFIPLSAEFGVTVRKEIPECGIITISNFEKKRTWFYLRYRIPDDWIESYETQDAVVHLLNLGDSWRFSWSQADIMWRKWRPVWKLIRRGKIWQSVTTKKKENINYDSDSSFI